VGSQLLLRSRPHVICTFARNPSSSAGILYPESLLVNGFARKTMECQRAADKNKNARAGVARASSLSARKNYAWLAAAAFLAAFAAFAAVEALRRLLVFGGVAGASPINSAVIILVTKSLGP